MHYKSKSQRKSIRKSLRKTKKGGATRDKTISPAKINKINELLKQLKQKSIVEIPFDKIHAQHIVSDIGVLADFNTLAIILKSKRSETIAIEEIPKEIDVVLNSGPALYVKKLEKLVVKLFKSFFFIN